MVDQRKLTDFLEESNRIDNVFHVKGDEVDAAMAVVGSSTLTIGLLSKYVSITAPGATLCNEAELTHLLDKINNDVFTPFMGHIFFGLTFPFTDGNGRLGRLVWYWHMQKHGGVQRSFLQQWYHDSLRALG